MGIYTMLLLIVSKDDKFSILNDKLNKFITEHTGSSYETIANNKENVTVIYNRYIEKALQGNFDYLVVMHSDVEIDLNKLYDHIIDCSEKYDVMGLCGCEKISVSENPLNWYCGSRKFPEFRWGCVCHGELGNSVSFFSGDRKETTDHPVACIDGLCITLSKKAMASGLRFDENLRFNCYDTQISFDAILKYKLRVGCLVETELKHYSVGKSILTDTFLDDEIVLRKRFGFEVPKDSRLAQYIASKNQGGIIDDSGVEILV